VVACNPKYDDNLLLVQRDGAYVKLEDYISQKVAEQIREHFGVETDDEVEYCPKCDAEWSGTSCGLPDCGWIVGVE
jgi:hypothetical protein